MRRGQFSAIVAMLAALVLGGCGEDASPGAPGSAATPALHSFDLYAMGNAEGNILFADLYGITFNPLTVHQITTDKRISTLSASRDTIAVAAGDEQIDKLALVQEGGVLLPLPGLGRPHAFSPEIRPNGRIRFDDSGPEDDKEIWGRYREYDPQTQRTRTLFESAREINPAGAVPGGLFLELIHRDDANDQVAVVQRDGERQTYTIAPRIGGAVIGARYVAVGVYPSGDPAAEPTDTVLLNLSTAKTVRVAGWSALAWSPDGNRLLVMRPSADRRDTELATLDPRRPQAVQPVGLVPGVALYGAAWVSGEPQSS